MRNDLTELVFILDRSGSMAGLEADTIGGFNSVLERNMELPGEALVTTVLFSHESKLLHDRQPIQAVMPMTTKDYFVGGSTALLDALGEAIAKVDNAHQHIAKEYRPGKVQFVIVTDGQENASRKWHLREIRRLVDARREQGWDFLFLGANMDAITTAESMGISPDRAVTAIADQAGVSLQYDAVAAANMAYRMGMPMGSAWKEEVERDTNARGHGQF